MEAEGMQQIVDKLTQEKNATISKIYQLGDTEQIKVMMLRHYQGMSWDEISNETGLSTSKLMSVNKVCNEKARKPLEWQSQHLKNQSLGEDWKTCKLCNEKRENSFSLIISVVIFS